MRIGTMLADILRSLLSKPVTELYPAKPDPVPPRLRAKLVWNPENCTGCCLCVKDCPSNALEVITVDKEKKQFVVRYDIGRCTFCAQCVQNCRFNCLEMTHDQWELAAREKQPFVVEYGDAAALSALMEKRTAKGTEGDSPSTAEGGDSGGGKPAAGG